MGVRKSNRSVKLGDEVLAWLSLWSEMQIICMVMKQEMMGWLWHQLDHANSTIGWLAS